MRKKIKNLISERGIKRARIALKQAEERRKKSKYVGFSDWAYRDRYSYRKTN